mgnify:CR=1 FL=1
MSRHSHFAHASLSGSVMRQINARLWMSPGLGLGVSIIGLLKILAVVQSAPR